MKIHVMESPQGVGQLGAEWVIEQIRSKPKSVLGLPTGETPRELYSILCESYATGHLDFAEVITFNLDEYVGLPPTHPSSYHSYMNRHLFSKVNLNPSHCFIPNGMAIDLDQECAHYEELIRQKGPVDLQILGIGRDGHIGFNEPGSTMDSLTRVQTLAPTTLEDNSKQFQNPQEMPRQVITMGVGTILRARQIVLLAYGEGKAWAVSQMIEGLVSTAVPATFLQTHPDVTIIIDSEAAKSLNSVPSVGD
jgi:glucosamine-6-phosphate deaminase